MWSNLSNLSVNCDFQLNAIPIRGRSDEPFARWALGARIRVHAVFVSEWQLKKGGRSFSKTYGYYWSYPETNFTCCALTPWRHPGRLHYVRAYVSYHTPFQFACSLTCMYLKLPFKLLTIPIRGRFDERLVHPDEPFEHQYISQPPSNWSIIVCVCTQHR